MGIEISNKNTRKVQSKGDYICLVDEIYVDICSCAYVGLLHNDF